MPLVCSVGGRGLWFISGTLQDAVASTSNGTWQNLNGIHPASITVGGTFVATVKILVSNAPTKPLDSDNAQAQLGSDITTPQTLSTDLPYRWVKAQVSAFSSGSITVSVMSTGQPSH